MLVCFLSILRGIIFEVITLQQLNTLETTSTMTFNLTESPFIRAGRQYSVRVSSSPICVPKGM